MIADRNPNRHFAYGTYLCTLTLSRGTYLCTIYNNSIYNKHMSSPWIHALRLKMNTTHIYNKLRLEYYIQYLIS